MSLYDPPIIATGGDTVQDINGNRIHTFTTVGTSSFVVTRGGPVEVLVVAGGGGGGGVFISFHPAGGGGAGELIYSGNYSVSPGSISVTVGEGGVGGSNNTPTFQTSTNGGNSVFGTLTAQGGGRGGDSRGGGGGTIGGNGGSGGGAGRFSSIGGSSTKTIGYGNSGGAAVFSSGGGGGGAGGVGLDSYDNGVKTPGGSGLSYKISGSSVTYAAGGTGGMRNTTANGDVVPANTGRGGNAASVAINIVWGVDTAPSGSNGGSGIVIVRYPLGTVLTLQVLNGLTWGYYTGYFADDVNFFTRAPSVSGIVTSIPSINAGTNGYVPSNGSGSNYSVRWIGYFLSNYTGTWTFYTSSDDASYLWIGPNATSGFTMANANVNNSGTHPLQERSGTVSLVAGQYYPILIQFGESAGGDNMIVSFENPGLAKTTNGQGFFYTTPTPAGFAGPAAPSLFGIFTSTPNGLTADQAATSGLALRQGYPGYTSGTYWLKPTSESTPGLAFVDMTTDGGGWTLVYETVTATRVGGSIVYSFNNSSNLVALSFTRVAYSMNNFNSWAFTSFDSWSSTIPNYRIPSTSDVLVNQRLVTNLNVVSSNTNVTTGTGLNGALEIWPYNYSTGRTLSMGTYGSDATYDINDTYPFGGSYGSFQVHDITNLRPVICWNNHSGTPDIGFGPRSGGAPPDWTFANTGATADFRVRVFVR